MPLITNIKKEAQGIGTIFDSMLSEAQFQIVWGADWFLCDGRSCTGTKYYSLTGNTSVPDMRSTVKRMKDHGAGKNPAGDVTLGAYQDDALQGHAHEISINSFSSPSETLLSGTEAGGSTQVSSTGGVTENLFGTPKLSIETRMKNTTVNFFIKVN